MLKWAGIAKATFPELRTYSYPGQTGGLGVDFLNPHLFGYGNVTTTGSLTQYYNIAGALGTTEERTWDIPLVLDTRQFLLGAAAGTYYKACSTAGYHSFVVLFQDGIIELGTDPSIDQLHFKSELMDKYTPISSSPLIRVPIENGKNIFQYTTPGMIPCSHQTGMHISAQPLYTRVAHIPLLGMCFYETSFNLETMVAH
jgi:hypothetical protein